MLHPLPPAEAYRRVELDAWIAGGDQRQLTRICLAEAIAALNRAMLWDGRGDDKHRQTALLKAISCIHALRMGLDPDHQISGALRIVYGDACHKLTLALRLFDRQMIMAVRKDFLDLEQAFAGTI